MQKLPMFGTSIVRCDESSRALGLVHHLRWILVTAIAAAIVVAGVRPAFAQIVAAPRIEHSKAGPWVKGRILVAPNAGLSDADFDGILKGVGAKSRKKLDALNIHVVELPLNAHGRERDAAGALRGNKHLKFAEVDEIVSLSATTNDPILPNEWHASKIGAPTAWSSSTGQGIVVAVIDSGVQTNHPDLAANLVPGWNVYDNNSNTNDVQGHGTAVAGTIAAIGNNGIGVVGVAYGAKIMPIRATDASTNTTFSILANGLTWAADHGADVANISYSNLYKSSTMQAAAQYFRDRGGVTVVSANNNAIDEGSPNTSTMITVSATDQNDALASFSSWGSMVDLAAPGVTIQTTLWNSGYGWGTGTSFATPVVAGTVALVMSANPGLTSSQVENALFTTGQDFGAGGYDTRFGWGRVNAAGAVQVALATPLPDSAKPSASITSPTGGSLSGLVPVAVTASDNMGVTRVDLLAGGTLIATDTTPPYSFTWDTTKFANAAYALTARAYDAAGNVGASSPISVTVSNATPPPPPPTATLDTIPPVAAIANPKNGARVKGSVSIQASATDNVGVKSLKLYVDGVLVATGNGASLSYGWNASKASRGTHTIRAVAGDAAGNAGSVSISVTN